MSDPSWGQMVRTPGFARAVVRCLPWTVPALVLLPPYLLAVLPAAAWRTLHS